MNIHTTNSGITSFARSAFGARCARSCRYKSVTLYVCKFLYQKQCFPIKFVTRKLLHKYKIWIYIPQIPELHPSPEAHSELAVHGPADIKVWLYTFVNFCIKPICVKILTLQFVTWKQLHKYNIWIYIPQVPESHAPSAIMRVLVIHLLLLNYE